MKQPGFSTRKCARTKTKNGQPIARGGRGKKEEAVGGDTILFSCLRRVFCKLRLHFLLFVVLFLLFVGSC